MTKENPLHNKAEGPSIEIEDDTLKRFSWRRKRSPGE
jgi:hypothetical protein